MEAEKHALLMVDSGPNMQRVIKHLNAEYYGHELESKQP